MGLKRRIAVLISGRGSNLQALIDQAQQPGSPAEIVCVVSNKPNVYGLERASNANIPTLVIDHKAFADRTLFEEALTEKLRTYHVELICLAGFMRVLSPYFISAWEGRILNIHPSLLPKYKGLDTHARALAAGDAESGCSVHIVTADLDGGPVIVQKRVPILETDTPDLLAARVLKAEHLAYPEAVEIMSKRLL